MAVSVHSSRAAALTIVPAAARPAGWRRRAAD